MPYATVTFVTKRIHEAMDKGVLLHWNSPLAATAGGTHCKAAARAVHGSK